LLISDLGVNYLLYSLQKHRIEPHIWGCGSVKTGGADVEAAFARMVDIMKELLESELTIPHASPLILATTYS
jgi:hypothetical protein